MDELYLDNIDEYVNDHDKIVTYKWLSLTLGVHVNTAKRMLFHYLDHKRKECSAQLHATYLVSGKFVDNGHTSHKVSVVREEQLEDIKSKMSLIVSVHVYSVQKALLKDSGPLYAVDYDIVKDNLMSCSRYSAIRCASAMPVSSQELQQARDTPRPQTPEQKSSTIVNGNKAAPKPSAKPQKGIMSLFSNKSTPKNQETVVEVEPEQEEDASVDGGPKSKATSKINPMANFFWNKTTSGKCLDGDGSKKKTAKIVKEEEAAPVDQPLQSIQLEKRPEGAEVKSVKETVGSRSKTKRMEESDSEQEMEKKKRRRIKRPEPDSSDEDVIPDSPQPAPPREPSPLPKMETENFSQLLQRNPGGRIRKRRRILKSRTFVDNEGCIVTEKGYESESYSEEESAPAPKPAPKFPAPARPQTSKENESKSNKKNLPHSNKGSKQASIMGFFQKK